MIVLTFVIFHHRGEIMVYLSTTENKVRVFISRLMKIDGRENRTNYLIYKIFRFHFRMDYM